MQIQTAAIWKGVDTYKDPDKIKRRARFDCAIAKVGWKHRASR